MKKVEISLIIPVYNVEKYLKQCLDSIINQTFKEIEVICIDDGSDDNSYEILKRYAASDSRFIVTCQKNHVAAIARNTGLKIAAGKYVQFLDADDYFEPNMLQELYDKAEETNADMVVCSARKVDVNGYVIEQNNPNWPINILLAPVNKAFNWHDFSDSIFSLFCVVPWNKLYLRKMLTDNNLQFQNLKSSNDLSFGHISRICASKIIILDKILINYRYNRAGSIAKLRVQNSINIIEACLKVKEFLQGKGLYEDLKQSFNRAFINHIRAGVSLCDDNEYKKFIYEFKNLMPDEFKKYEKFINYEYITPEYLKEFIGDKKVLLWGASLFIRKVLESENIPNPNILGIIDNNSALWGQMCGYYKILSPDLIGTINPDGILLTVLSDNEKLYTTLEEKLKKQYSDIILLPNIFTPEEIVNG